MEVSNSYDLQPTNYSQIMTGCQCLLIVLEFQVYIPQLLIILPHYFHCISLFLQKQEAIMTVTDVNNLVQEFWGTSRRDGADGTFFSALLPLFKILRECYCRLIGLHQRQI